MNGLKKSAGLMVLLVCVVFHGPSATAMNADDAPETVTIASLQELYEAVTFDHRMHIDLYDCSSCHHHTTGTGAHGARCEKCHAEAAATTDVSCSSCHEIDAAIASPATKSAAGTNRYHIDIPVLKAALHLQCLGCHRDENGPMGCRECHGFTAAGKKRFAIKD